MPNDPTTGSFPQPIQTTPEIQLTDAVAPDLSQAKPDLAPPESPPIIEETPNSSPEPIEVIAPEPAAQIPATMPTSIRKPFPIVTALLLLISIGAIAATYFFYQQTKSLNAQLTQITQTMQQQQIKENQIIPQPKADPPLAETPTFVPSPTATASATGKVFGDIQTVIATAQKQYPSAQLIMIKTDNFQDPTLAVIKYWFRQTPTDKKYLYVMAEPNKDLVVVDQQVTVAENTLTPSLNQLAANSQLGIDLPEAVSISSAACPTTFNCATTSISGQYIKSSATLWQISFKPSDNSQPFVVQIDAATKKILYKSL
ncbi:hypothetical protein HYU90_01920 [Candidatus Collierbacteria bacterium]|nr:hypothetical protein [Candidatus Collierbacteria bacterium]